MKRISRKYKTVITLFLWISIFPDSIFALGFGKPIAESALGEPLRVIVPLTITDDEKSEDLTVGLAEPSWFQRFNIEYSGIAEEIKATVDYSDRDRPVALLVTTNPVSQIVVPLIIELRLDNRVLRKQMSILLNPKNYEDIAPPAAAKKVVSLSANSTQSSNPPNGQQSQPSLSYSPDSVKVKPGESLSLIVDQHLPKGATRYQGRLAFYHANPDAFQNGNINLLTSGVELAIPPAEDVFKLTAKEAKQSYVKLAEQSDLELAELNTRVVDDTEEQPVEPVEPAAPIEGEQPTTTLATTADRQSDNGFRLSVVEVEDNGAANTESTGNVAQSGTAPEIESPSTTSNAATLDGFEMQSFTMKVTVLNAYIVELQDENRLLKERLSALENKVEALITQSQLAANQALSATAESLQASAEDTDDSIIAPDQTTTANAVPPTVDQPVDEQNHATVAQDFEAEALGTVDDTASNVADQKINDSGNNTEIEATDEQPIATEEENNLITKVDSEEITTASDGNAPPPRKVYQQNLFTDAGKYLKQINTPIAQLVIMILLLAILLFVWMLWRDRKKQKKKDDEDQELDYGLYERGAEIDRDGNSELGVRYSKSMSTTMLDLDEESELWMSAQNYSEQDIDTLIEHDVDLITQSEVYITYNRMTQAEQVLLEEYEKEDTDKYAIATRLLHVYEKMGDTEARSEGLTNFITRLNTDIELFTSREWEALHQDLETQKASVSSTYSGHSHRNAEPSSPGLQHPVLKNAAAGLSGAETKESVIDDGTIDLDYIPPAYKNPND